ncbi:MAG: hypothetical protein HQL40_15565, partial [Alphaproteobacteria bacterium]|nr:hypothetical protein [Alphaproteobacteria bacterium]
MSEVVLATLHLRSQADLGQCRTHMAQFAVQAGIGRGSVTRAVTAVSEVTRAALLVYGGLGEARFLTRVAGGRRCLALELEGRPLTKAAGMRGVPQLPGVVESVRRLLDSATLETRPDGLQRVRLEVRLPESGTLAPPPDARTGLARHGDADHRQALAAVHAATWAWHPATGRVHLDPLGQALLGLAAGEFGGTLQALIECIHPSDGAAFGEAIEHAEAGGICHIARVIRGDGEIREIQFSGGRLADGAGLGGILIDLTERLASQRARDDRQRQKLEVIGELAGAMAHEINNLLQPVIGVASLLREDVDGVAESRALAADLDIILDSARKAASILHDVLTFARPSDGGRMAPRSLSDAVRDSLRFLRSLLSPSIHLRVDMPEAIDDTVMLGDTSIQQILTNLVTNAAQAMNQVGTISISV